MKTIAASACVLVAGPLAAQDDGVETLEPVSSWRLDLGEDYCALSRSFGTEEAPVLLELRQYAPGAPYTATILRKSDLRPNPEPSLYFGPIEDVPRTGRASTLEVEDYRGVRALVYSRLGLPESIHLIVEDPERDAGEEALQWLHVADVFENDFRLRTGGMHAVLSAMRDCQAGLVSHWGFDSAEQRTLTANAEIEFDDSWVVRAMRNVPTRSFRNGRVATLYLLAFSDNEGQIIDCRALSPQDSGETATSFCETAVQQGRATPAINAAGAPVASTVIFGFSRVMRTSSNPYP